MIFIVSIMVLMLLLLLILLFFLERNNFTYWCSKYIIEDISHHYIEAMDIIKKNTSCDDNVNVYNELLVSYNRFLFNFRADNKLYFIKKQYRESFCKIINKKGQD